MWQTGPLSVAHQLLEVHPLLLPSLAAEVCPGQHCLQQATQQGLVQRLQLMRLTLTNVLQDRAQGKGQSNAQEGAIARKFKGAFLSARCTCSVNHTASLLLVAYDCCTGRAQGQEQTLPQAWHQSVVKARRAIRI